MYLEGEHITAVLCQRFFPVDVEVGEDCLYLLSECHIAVKADLFTHRGRQFVILGGEISQRHQASRNGGIDFACWGITAKTQPPATGMTIQLKSEIGDINGDAIALHFATALQCSLVQCEQPIAANLGNRQQ